MNTIYLILDYSIEILPIFFLAVLIAAFLEEFLSIRFVQKFLTNRNIFNVFLASVAGALIPLCTCGMVPLAVMLRKKQADFVPLLAFLTAGVASSVPALLLTLILGVEITLMRLGVAFLFGVVVAYIMVLVSGKRLSDVGIEISLRHHCTGIGCVMCLEEEKVKGSFFEKARWKRAGREFIEDLKEFGPWVIVSIVIAAAVSSFVSREAVEGVLGGGNPFSFIIAPLIGLPFYFCAGTDIPLVSALLEKGMSLGNALAIMTAVPVINIPAYAMFSKWLGQRNAVFYFIICWFVAAFIALVFNVSLPF